MNNISEKTNGVVSVNDIEDVIEPNFLQKSTESNVLLLGSMNYRFLNKSVL